MDAVGEDKRKEKGKKGKEIKEKRIELEKINGSVAI